MACSICHLEGHNRSTCPQNPQLLAARVHSVTVYNDAPAKTSAWARDRQRLVGWGCLIVIAALALPLLFSRWLGRTPDSAEPQVAVSPAAPPTQRPAPRPRSAPARPNPETAPTSTAHYDKNGLVDGGIPGAPPGWKPAPMPPAPKP
jgi:hypothetical protein